MLSSKFGIEIEFTGINRFQAADVVSRYLGGEVTRAGDYYDTHIIKAPDGRSWKIMFDSSITCRRRASGRLQTVGSEYSCELVSPILTYREDIGILQDIVRRLRKAGGITNHSCGIHIHLDGSPHTPQSVRNFINLIASRNDLFYKALQIEDERMRYCKKMDAYLVERMNQKKPKTFAQLEEIWYAGYGGSRNGHYHDSRYHFLNLHCFFHGNHTIELRGFNSELHAGKIRAYIVFALAMNHQALTQKSASYRKVQEENEKFAILIWELTPRDEAALDIYEGYPRLYRKETLAIKLGKKKFPAMIYIMNGEQYPYGYPSKSYFNIIRDGYIAVGFDPKLLHQAVAENLKGEIAL